ncbi:MAG: hypothetical protein Roseis2KO_23020 [Roseivirga sp.]
MEINDLKSVWKKASDQKMPGYWVSEEDVRTMISNKSHTTLAGIARALKFKIRTSSFGVLISIAAIVFTLNAGDPSDKTYLFGLLKTPEQFAIAMGSLGLVLLRFSVFVRLRYRQIREYETSTYALSDSIESAASVVKNVIRTGTHSDTFGMTVLALWVGYSNMFGPDDFAPDLRLLYLILTGLIASVLLYQISKRLHYNKYRHFLEALEQCQEELNEVDAEINDSEL